MCDMLRCVHRALYTTLGLVPVCEMCDMLRCVHRALNTTLGLGSNRIFIILQDAVTGSTLNTYRLTLHRHKADYAEPSFDSDTAYAVCGLRQVSLPADGHIIGH